jgi:hypothetical protein
LFTKDIILIDYEMVICYNLIGTFNRLGVISISKRNGGDSYEYKGFFNSFTSYNNFFVNITTLCSIEIKKHLTQHPLI